LISEKPDAVLVYGDTNATIAGALAAVKLHIPVAHVEAGLRSFNRRMPEEINRVVTDHVSTWLYTPTQTATDHLANEGMSQGVLWVGDVMLDAVDQFGPLAEQQCAGLLDELELGAKQYWLMTMHRAESTDQPEQVKTILTTLDSLGTPILFPVHPRIKAMVESFGPYRHIRLTDPMGYFEMLMAERHASLIVTDSGGVQKEAVFANVPCVTMRTETEWTETVQAGWNQIVGLDANKLVAAIEQADSLAKEPIRHHYGNGAASQTIARHLSEALDHAAQQKPATETGVTVPV
ncbi:MAG: UDP-N-acetylglucosamine 2-epimerase (non-hydrolyzing), partial [Cyanobacteria bacterium HKST-UBA05]|nr:UDP-N-acetylglucosamine 2-epimerase (non-hydrolyzing) [Cyanobacteria bacterium HKST-UBA05]